MLRLERFANPGSLPRVLTIGCHEDALGRTVAPVAASQPDIHCATSGGLRSWFTSRRRAEQAVRDGVEALHLLDARLAPAVMPLRRRHGVPVAITISARDVTSRTAMGRAAWRAIERADQVFVSDASLAREALDRSRRLPLMVTPPVASSLAEPSQRAMASMTRLLSGIAPGRLVIALPWTADREYMRWYRDAVVPLLIGNPLTLVLGAPSRRQARLLAGAFGTRTSFRSHVGRLTADALAAAIRCADAFVLAGPARGIAGLDDLALSLSASRTPLVTSGAVQSRVLHHERNALTVEPGDGFGLVSTVNKLLALPPEQRHYLGADFAAYALETWRPEVAAEVYAERFCTLVGRPVIPMQLRAA